MSRRRESMKVKAARRNLVLATDEVLHLHTQNSQLNTTHTPQETPMTASINRKITPADVAKGRKTPAKAKTSLTPQPYAEMVNTTPEVAKFWLARNPHNRKQRPAMVAALAKAMREGRFLFNGDTVRISWDDELMDAQHRLAAVVESGITVPMLFVYNIDPAAMATIDQGVHRTVTDILQIRGVDATDINVLAATTRLLTSMTEEIGSGLQRDQVADYIEAHLDEMEGLVSWAHGLAARSPKVVVKQRARQAVGPSTLLALVIHMIRAGADPNTVVGFFEAVVPGATGMTTEQLQSLTSERLSIVQAVQRRFSYGELLNNASSTAWRRHLQEFHLYINTYNRWVHNEAVQKLQIPTTTHRWLHELPEPTALVVS